MIAPWKKSYDQPRQRIKKQTSLCHQICSQRYGFSNSFTGVSWTIKKAECQRIDAFELVLEKTLESLGLQGNQSWIFTGRTEAEAPNTLATLLKELTHWKRPIGGDKRMGSLDVLNGHELEQTPGDGEGQGSLVCYSPLGSRVRHNLATEQQVKSPTFLSWNLYIPKPQFKNTWTGYSHRH